MNINHHFWRFWCLQYCLCFIDDVLDLPLKVNRNQYKYNQIYGKIYDCNRIMIATRRYLLCDSKWSENQLDSVSVEWTINMDNIVRFDIFNRFGREHKTIEEAIKYYNIINHKKMELLNLYDKDRNKFTKKIFKIEQLAQFCIYLFSFFWQSLNNCYNTHIQTYHNI